MENSRGEKPPKTIIRQTEVLRRTGFSRSTLYMRIAKGEFPHQVSLGARSVGWLEEEVDTWIAQRACLRPASESETWRLHEESRVDITLADSSRSSPLPNKPIRNPARTEKQLRGSLPNLAQLELIGTNVYVDKATGTLWFQVLSPKRTAD